MTTGVLDGSTISRIVSTTIGTPSSTATHVRAGDARTARTARKRIARPTNDRMALPSGVPSMNGNRSTLVSCTASSTADGWRHRCESQANIAAESTVAGRSTTGLSDVQFLHVQELRDAQEPEELTHGRRHGAALRVDNQARIHELMPLSARDQRAPTRYEDVPHPLDVRAIRERKRPSVWVGEDVHRGPVSLARLPTNVLD